MQVQIETKPADWQPKTLSITFETEEEFEAFGDMMQYDWTIPEAICETKQEKTLLAGIMQKIRSAFSRV